MDEISIEDLLGMSLQELIAMLSKKGSGKIEIEVGKSKRPTPQKRSSQPKMFEGKDEDDECGCGSQDDQSHINSSYS